MCPRSTGQRAVVHWQACEKAGDIGRVCFGYFPTGAANYPCQLEREAFCVRWKGMILMLLMLAFLMAPSEGNGEAAPAVGSAEVESYGSSRAGPVYLTAGPECAIIVSRIRHSGGVAPFRVRSRP